MYGKFHHNILHSSRDRAKPRPMINVFLQFLGLYHFNIKLSAKCYENIPNGLRVKFHFFQNLNLSKTSTNPKCHLTISCATSCQYQCVCKISSQYSTLWLDLVNINVYAKCFQNMPLSSRDRAIFTFLRIWHSAQPRPMINVILQFLGLDLVNINVSAKFYKNIPNGLRVKFHFF